MVEVILITEKCHLLAQQTINSETTLKDFIKEISVFFKKDKNFEKKYSFFYENKIIKESQILTQLIKDKNSIVIQMRRKNILKGFFTYISECLENPSILSNFVKAITILNLILHGRRAIAFIIFCIYLLVAISNYKFIINTGEGNYLQKIGKVIFCFFSSLFLIYGEENFV